MGKNKDCLSQDQIDQARERFRLLYLGLLLPDGDYGWTKVGGVRLMVTPSGFCVREDMTGPLFLAPRSYIIFGRKGDADKRLRMCDSMAEKLSLELALACEVSRDHIDQLFETSRSRKRDCMVKYDRDSQKFVKPDPFVTVRTKNGNLSYRLIVGGL